MILVLLVVLVGVGLWWFFDTHNTASLEALARSGFRVDFTLEHNVTPVAFDTGARKLAFVTLPRTLVYRYDQVERWELRRWQRPGGKDKSEPTIDRELTFFLRDPEHPRLRLQGFDEADVGRWYERLKRELPQGGEA